MKIEINEERKEVLVNGELYVKHEVKSEPVEVKPKLSKKWGGIVPHVSWSKGAVSPPIPSSWNTEGEYAAAKRINEYDYGLIELKSLKDAGLIKAYRDTSGDRISGNYSAHKKASETLSQRYLISPHKNAYNGKVGGFEVLILKGDQESFYYARLWLEVMSKHFPDRKHRGVKEIASGGRGYGNLAGMKDGGAKVALLTEAFFIDNPSDYITQDEMHAMWKEFFERAEEL